MTIEHEMISEVHLPNWLQKQIKKFRTKNDYLGSPTWSMGLCVFASGSFVQELFGIPEAAGQNPHIVDVTKDPYYAKLISSGSYNARHYVARVGNYLIDWTARQFRPEEQFPRIWGVSDKQVQPAGCRCD